MAKLTVRISGELEEAFELYKKKEGFTSYNATVVSILTKYLTIEGLLPDPMDEVREVFA